MKVIIYCTNLITTGLWLVMVNELPFFGFLSLDIIMGMALGMIASPLLMKAIRVMRKRRKINKLLKDIADSRKNNLNNSDVLSE